MNYYNYKPTEEQLAAQRARVHVDFTALDMNDPDALEKWKYPLGRQNLVQIGDRALLLVGIEVPEAA